jgi:hypothetical protein
MQCRHRLTWVVGQGTCGGKKDTYGPIVAAADVKMLCQSVWPPPDAQITCGPVQVSPSLIFPAMPGSNRDLESKCRL